MKCPNDNATLLITDRQGIEIDYCPECRGVWLDRGELDKMLQRDNDFAQASAQQHHQQSQNHNYRNDDDDDYRHNNHHSSNSHGHHKKKEREGFLGDLFDF